MTMVFHLCVRKPPFATAGLAVQSGAGGKVRAELPHDGSVAQALLRLLHGAVVLLHVFCKWSEWGFSWGAIFELGLAKLQLPLAKSADEALGVQGFGVASNSERQTQEEPLKTESGYGKAKGARICRQNLQERGLLFDFGSQC